MRHSIMPAPKILRLMPCLCAAAAAVVLMTAQAAAQSVTDTVRVLFRVDAPAASTVKAAIAAANASACTGDSAAVTPKASASARDTLTLLIGPGPNSALRGQHGQNAPALVSYSRGSVSLKLRTQQYGSANVSLYTVNGRRVLHNKISASSGAHSVSRSNLPAGAYMLSVKGTNGNAFTAKLAHSGGKLNINVTFGGEGFSLGKQAAEHCGVWTMTLSAAAGYHDTTHTVGIDAAAVTAGEIDIGTVALRPLPTVKQFTVTFDSDGGSLVSPIAVDSGTAAGAKFPAANPTKAGHTFSGWFDEASTPYDAQSAITKDVTLKAAWIPVLHTVTFNTNGAGNIPSVQVPHNNTLGTDLRADIQKTGYTFAGWFAGETEYKASTPITGNVTLAASWTPVTYTITYNLNSGTVATANPTSYTVETATFTLTNPTRTGYTFAGWTGDNGTTPQTPVSIPVGSTGNRSYTANWTVSVTFHLNYGDSPAVWVWTVAPTGTDGRLASLPNAPTRLGYDFAGWFTAASGGEAVSASRVYTARDTVYARWTVITYTITYTLNNGTVATANPTSYNVTTASFTLRNPTRANYVFAGWTGSNGTTPQTTVTIPLGSAGNRNYAANWKEYDTLTDTRGTTTRTYRTIDIGNQIWMAQNLNYAGPSNNLGVCYQNMSDSCGRYGRLYTWSEVMNGGTSSSTNPSGRQGICPTGWHVPSDAEWDVLMTAVGGSSTAGTKLKSSTVWRTYSGIPAGTNEHGFSALPGGFGYGSSFASAGYSGRWWSATESGASYAYGRNMGYDDESVFRDNDGKSDLFSLRCLRD